MYLSSRLMIGALLRMGTVDAIDKEALLGTRF